MTQFELEELDNSKNRPSSAYKRLSSALKASKSVQDYETKNAINRGRTHTNTMKTELQQDKFHKLKEFCSWECMKKWLRKNTPKQFIYQTELLIDLQAGYQVDI